MLSTSVRELHIHTSALVKDAAEGATIIIERRGMPVAELRPLSLPAALLPAKKKKIFDRLEKFWAKQPQMLPDSTQTVSEDRDR